MQPLLTRRQVAEILRIRPQTLAAWAMTGKHLPVVKVGNRAVRYRAEDVEKFIQQSRFGGAGK